MDAKHKKIAIRLLMEKSNRNLEQAIKNAELEYWDLVANRLYYSIFHAVTALLLKDGHKSNSHKGTSSQFGMYYVIPGIFSKEDGSFYSRLQTMREKADYQNIFSLTEQQGKEYINKTLDLQKRILEYISHNINDEI